LPDAQIAAGKSSVIGAGAEEVLAAENWYLDGALKQKERNVRQGIGIRVKGLGLG